MSCYFNQDTKVNIIFVIINKLILVRTPFTQFAHRLASALHPLKSYRASL